MKANELRIGSCYLAPIGFFKGSVEVKLGADGEVFTMTLDKLKLISQLDLLQYIKPIYLTRDWPERLGFTMIEKGDGYQGGTGPRWKIKHPEYPFGKDIEIYGGEGFYYNGVDSVRLIYVHQLQNLYFALTGKELEVKMKKWIG